MLDLEARIGLDERGCFLPGRIPVDQEFERAEAHEFCFAGELERRFGNARANGLVERRRRGDLDQLLIAALQGAFAIAQDRNRPPVADHLHFDMARAPDQPLDVKLPAAERRQRFRSAARVGVLELRRIVDDAHAAAAAPAIRP